MSGTSGTRECWDHYFLRIAEAVKTRATCKRLQVGCVLVSPDRLILATGYNGSVRGASHCIDDECVVEHGHCVNTIHAEMNAIIQAARRGVQIYDSSAYITHHPCWSCYKALVNAGVGEIFYASRYAVDSRVATACLVPLIEVSGACPGERLCGCAG